MELVPILFIWLIGTILVGVIADKKGRSVFGWVVLSLFIQPLVAIIIIAIIGESNENRIKRIIEEEKLREAIRKGEDISKMNFSDNVSQSNHSEESSKIEEEEISDAQFNTLAFIMVGAIVIILIIALIIGMSK